MTGWLRRIRPRSLKTSVSSVAELADEVRRRIAIDERTSGERPTLRGQLAGVESDPAPADPRGPVDGSPLYRAGYSTGRVQAHMVRTLGTLPGDLVIPTALYAAALTVEPASRVLDEGGPTGLLQAHAAAAVRTRKAGGLPTDVELILFRWLAAQRSIEITPELLTRYEAWRTRRLARQQGGARLDEAAGSG